VNNNRKHNNQTTARQGAEAASAEPLKIGASTPFDFSARHLTAYGGLLPVATMLGLCFKCSAKSIDLNRVRRKRVMMFP
jgi:hypothetical protein